MIDAYANEKKDRSSYQPSKAVQERTLKDKKAYEKSYDIQRRGYAEFNGLTVLAVQDRDQKIFNLYEEPEPSDADLKWRSRAVRTGARNSVISIAAHLVSAMMYPNFTAQNEQDDEDQDAAQLMHDLILWNIENSDYEMSMLFGIVAACVNPAMYLSAEYAQAMQQLRDQYESKDKGLKEVLDEVLSGLQVEPIPMEEMLIANVYQYHHQKQGHRIRRRFISKDVFDARYGEHKNHDYVTAGVQAIFSESDKTYYDVEETAKSEDLVEEAVFMYRGQDLEIPYVNGIYFGADDVEKNPMKHRRLTMTRDGEAVSVPLYPEAKTGYEPIDEKRFYYYKSCIDKLLPDHKRLQKMARLAEDATVLMTLKPAITSGRAKVNQSVVFPSGVTSMPEGSKIDFLDIGANLNALYQHMGEAEKEMNKSAQDEVRQGNASSKQQTAYELSRIEQNAIIKEFAIFGRMIGRLVEDLGGLMADCAIQHQTVMEYEEIAGMPRLKVKQFLLNNQSKNGRKVTKKLMFTDEYMGRQMTKEQQLEESWKVYDEQEEQGGNIELFKVNPALFARRKYKAVCDLDSMMPKSMAFQEDRKLRAYQMLSVDPFADREAVARDFLFDPLTEGHADKYMIKAQALGIVPGMPGAPGAAPVPGAPAAAGNPQPAPALPEPAGAMI